MSERVAVYLDFDNVVISRYDDVHGKQAWRKDDPRKPPRWQVRATRIIHDDTEKMIYFEGARLEAFGYPVFYWPYLSTPDPTVKRKSGLLIPKFGYSSVMGALYSQPYFWALAPNYDLTVTPTLSSKQGLLPQRLLSQS